MHRLNVCTILVFVRERRLPLERRCIFRSAVCAIARTCANKVAIFDCSMLASLIKRWWRGSVMNTEQRGGGVVSTQRSQPAWNLPRRWARMVHPIRLLGTFHLECK